jgi:hypothetical protein
MPPRRIRICKHQQRLPGIRWPAPKPRTPRFDFNDLERLSRLPETILCERLRISWKTLKDYRADGIDALRADELAGRINRHPTEIWSHWK